MTNDNPIIDSSGSKFWHNQNGQYHRTDGPAIEWANGNKEWWFDGHHHREDGPAVECTNGRKSWYINDKQYSFQKWLTKCSLTNEEKIEMVLYYENI